MTALYAGSSPLARGLQGGAAAAQGRRGIIPARAGFTCGVRGTRTGAPDHPRSRGVYGGGEPSGLLDAGIIPARAGFTPCSTTPAGATRDHPRSRGVYSGSSTPGWTGAGSSPLARGLPVPAEMLPITLRIIPARAGFTLWPAGWSIRWRDHPRSRGVYSAPHKAQVTMRGSSPLARGLRRHHGRWWRGEWIIPARAGFTLPSGRRLARPADHPRSRGVYLFRAGIPRRVPGSSPLARGLLTLRRSGREATSDHPRSRGVYAGTPRGRDPSPGIIPACAGFTAASAAAPGFVRDHPRSRGVYLRPSRLLSSRSGSSPLARGLPSWYWRQRAASRIIPARAGFTRCRQGQGRGNGDHPRSRGVYVEDRTGAVLGVGSSPLARGLLLTDHRDQVDVRIIPARAGFTRRWG